MSSREYWAATLLLASLCLGWCQEPTRQPHKYVLPTGYVGWVRINFNVPDAAPLPVEEGFVIFKIPPSGLLNTSSKSEAGWAIDEYFISEGDSSQLVIVPRSRVWGAFTGSDEQSGKRASAYEFFFVGDSEAYEKYGQSRPTGLPIFGPLQKVSATREEDKLR